MSMSITETAQPAAALLHGDGYAPAILEQISSAARSIDVAAFSVSPRWPARGSQKANIFAGMLAAPASGRACTVVLATHKPRSPNAAFNWAASVKLVEAGWRVRWAPPAHLLHAKFWMFDKARVVIGSHNVAHSAITANLDLSVLLACQASRQQAAEWWAALLARSTARCPTPWQK